MRVLHIGKFYPPHIGGMETHVRTLCRELNRFLEVKVIVSSDNSDTAAEEIDKVEVIRAGRLLQVASAPICPRMSSLIRQTEAEIVHIHLPNPTALLAYWTSGHRGQLVISYHSDILRQRLLSRAIQPFQQQCMHRAAAIISATPNYIEHSPTLRLWRARCLVIPYGINPDLFQEQDDPHARAIQSRFGPNIVLSVGRLVHYKGFQYLIEAMKSTNGQLIIIGEGPLKRDLENVVRKLGLSHKVTILGGIRDLRPYYSAASVFALPSCFRTEAFGIVQLEAMASGKPVVNTSLDSGVPYVSQDGITGLTVPPRDPAALAQALTVILDNPALAARFGTAGRKRVIAEFTLDSMVQRTLSLYQRLSGLSAPFAALSKPLPPCEQWNVESDSQTDRTSSFSV